MEGYDDLNTLKIVLAAVILLLAYPSKGASTEQDAITFIEQTGLGNNLSSFALKTAIRTQTFGVITAELGQTKGYSLVQKHVEKSVKTHQEEWNRNLALSYLDHFSAAELKSILKEEEASPYVDKLRVKQGEVGASMQKRSTELLKAVVTEAMQNAYAEAL